MADPVAAAGAAVNPERYRTWSDGRPVRQVTNPDLTARILRFLDVRRGSRVLEVGTGSGYSAALLSVLVGRSGRVVSLDVDAELVERATRLLRGDGATNVLVVHRDGRLGYADEAPFDAVVSWASVGTEIPPPWTAQTRVGGTIVAPFTDGRIRKLRVTSEGAVAEEAAITGGFVPLTARPFRPWEDETGP